MPGSYSLNDCKNALLIFPVDSCNVMKRLEYLLSQLIFLSFMGVKFNTFSLQMVTLVAVHWMEIICINWMEPD